jgi:hypothetical protein
MKTYKDNGYRYYYDWHLQMWVIYPVDDQGNQITDEEVDYQPNRVELVKYYPKFKFNVEG